MTGMVDFEKQPPAWLQWLGNDAARVMCGDQKDLAPIGCHFYHDLSEDIWEITLFVSATEVVGGPKDGQKISSYYQIDVNAIVSLFDSTPQIRWQSDSFADDDQLGSHVSLEGIARGRDVWIRILQQPPDDFGPGRQYHALDGRFENLW